MNTLERAKSLAIWGFGREGRAAFAYIRAHYPEIEITILNDSPISLDLPEGVRLLTGAEIGAAIRAGKFDTLIRSPGITPYRDEIREAEAGGITCTSVTNLWFETARPKTVIAVTGTKGKSTTSSLIHHLIAASGAETRLLGNVGVAALGQEAARDYTVLELSSYQIADLAHAPRFAVFTNLYPEHVPWHGSVERYFADKLRLLELDRATIGVCNYQDRELRARVGGRENTVWYNQPRGFHVTDGQLFHGDELLDTSPFPLKGEHNLSNLAAACTLLELIQIDVRAVLPQLANFHQLPHRLQEFTIGGDILCVNDSISTVPESTIAALKAYRGHEITLLLGGTERGQDYHELYNFLDGSSVTRIVLLPPTGKRIFQELEGRKLSAEVIPAENLVEAMSIVFRQSNRGKVILLSPAAPSFGEFTNFEERGAAFEALCRSQKLPAG